MRYDDDSQNIKLVKLLGGAFIQRRDVKAVQNRDGSWMPVREDSKDPDSPFLPFTMMDFQYHLSGQRSYGHYLLDTENNCKLFAFDLDVCKPSGVDGGTVFSYREDDGTMVEYNPRAVWLGQDVGHPMYGDLKRQLTGMALALQLAITDLFGDDVRVAVCDTGGKGLHVYALYGVMPAEVARQAAHGVLEALGGFTATKGDNFFQYSTPENPNGYNSIELEVFPKQDTLEPGGLGNLMALPCGVNRKTGRERPFVRFDLSKMLEGEEAGRSRSDSVAMAEWSSADPIEILEGASLISAPELEKITSVAKAGSAA